MKKLLILNLFFLGIVGCVAPKADSALPKEATITANVQQVNIDGGAYFFKPNHVIVKVNIPVELIVKVESGLIPHNFVIQAPEAGIMVKESLSSDAKTIRFTPKAVGKYPFYCSHGLPLVKSHRERGMEGLIEVVE
ncbi:quinol oxidase [Tolumonas auensis]|uniref:quinol oxidase n=1 Tax=Tolumonas auensis TaxID=43948 RepID=UPI002AA7486A|nr:quinol oxidase [Tolumonas auensis]